MSGLPVKQQDQVISAGEALVWLWPLVVRLTLHIPGMTQPLLGALMYGWLSALRMRRPTRIPHLGVRPNLEVVCLFFSYDSFSSTFQANEKVSGFSLSFRGLYFSSSVTSSVSYEILTLIRGWEFPSIEDTPLTFEAGHHILKYSSQADAYSTHKGPCSLYPTAG